MSDVFSDPAVPEGFSCKRIGKFHREWDPTPEFDLPVEQLNRFRSGHPEFAKDGFHFRFERRFDACPDGCRFGHVTNVA